MTAARPTLLVAALSGVLLSGCITLNPKVDVLEPTQTRPVAAVQQPVSNGAIFQSAGYRPLYETHRARMVGDIVNIDVTPRLNGWHGDSSRMYIVGGEDAAPPYVSRLCRVLQVSRSGYCQWRVRPPSAGTLNR